MNPAYDYFTRVPEPYQEVILFLDTIINRTVPELQLKYKWKLPFYYLDEKTMFCFLNFRKNYIDLGLPYGIHLSDPNQILIAGDRKMMRSLHFTTLASIDVRLLTSILLELKGIRQKSRK